MGTASPPAIASPISPTMRVRQRETTRNETGNCSPISHVAQAEKNRIPSLWKGQPVPLEGTYGTLKMGALYVPPEGT
jgi:hypothetical protein